MEESKSDQTFIKGDLFRNGIFANIACCDTKEAYLRYLHCFKPDILLLNNVSSFDNMEALQIANSIYKNIPIIYITKTVSDELLKTLLNRIQALITKDCLEELVTLIQIIWLNVLLKSEKENCKMTILNKRLNSLKYQVSLHIENKKVFINL
ncbi:response regulator [Chondrinema litorale]|uniref:response regulator n=1 Tax=Chondrinema litorale TaxID=2994555 RepID=UPI002543C6C4|nr:response regulator [Chondrinema litorale]UZR99602.1 response regulator [Chondrinema litorale]